MPLQKGQNPNRPAPGSSIKVEPIRTKKAIENIKKILGDNPRDFCLFTLGINTAYRANELLSIRIGQVKNSQAGDTLDLKQSKSQKYRMTTLNLTAVESLKNYFKWDKKLYSRKEDDFLFCGRLGNVLTVPTLTNKV